MLAGVCTLFDLMGQVIWQENGDTIEPLSSSLLFFPLFHDVKD
jgi:hypothetical protein